MPNRPITIKDIATALNVSMATVSRALRDSYEINAATRKRIQEYAEAHHYRPNLSAQNLKNKRSRSIGVSITSIHNIFYADVLNGMESIAAEKDYHIIISQCHESLEKEARNIGHLMWRGVDGLIVSLSSESADLSHIQALADAGIPVVFFDRVPSHPMGHVVVSDNQGDSYLLTRHLLHKGYQRIAHITSARELSITVERLAGYKKALAEKGIAPNEQYIHYCPHGGMHMEELDAALNHLLALPHPPDAIFTASDRTTLGCFSLLKARGLRIPQDIALAGYSNFASPQLFDPPLTTISQPAFDMGKAAMTLLIQQLESKRPPAGFQTVVLPGVISYRGSA